ncbi:MAG TPA: GNAT family N-acetyltransferase [Ktedonobacterales bacterium]|nr:GNAT family N-acetyltransferase [Ktedonobacterales bacterium]
MREPRRPSAANGQVPTLLDVYLALSHVGAPATGPLAPLPGEEEEETPRLHITHTADGHWRVFMRADLPSATRQRLATLAPETLFIDHAQVVSILAEGIGMRATDIGVWRGRTLLFPDDLSSRLSRRQQDSASQATALDDLVRIGPGVDCYGQPAPDSAQRRPALAAPDEPIPPPETFPREQFAALADGVVVATCVSARESALAAEAWVRTTPAARGRGYATRVTAAWALDVRWRGKTPFYSYARDNRASAGVARSLDLVSFLDDVGYL